MDAGPYRSRIENIKTNLKNVCQKFTICPAYIRIFL